MDPPGPSLLLLLLRLSLSLAVGPDITARDRLVKDLPNGVFAGRKLTPKVSWRNRAVMGGTLVTEH